MSDDNQEQPEIVVATLTLPDSMRDIVKRAMDVQAPAIACAGSPERPGATIRGRDVTGLRQTWRSPRLR